MSPWLSTLSRCQGWYSKLPIHLSIHTHTIYTCAHCVTPRVTTCVTHWISYLQWNWPEIHHLVKKQWFIYVTVYVVTLNFELRSPRLTAHALRVGGGVVESKRFWDVLFVCLLKYQQVGKQGIEGPAISIKNKLQRLRNVWNIQNKREMKTNEIKEREIAGQDSIT